MLIPATVGCGSALAPLIPVFGPTMIRLISIAAWMWAIRLKLGVFGRTKLLVAVKAANLALCLINLLVFGCPLLSSGRWPASSSASVVFVLGVALALG